MRVVKKFRMGKLGSECADDSKSWANVGVGSNLRSHSWFEPGRSVGLEALANTKRARPISRSKAASICARVIL